MGTNELAPDAIFVNIARGGVVDTTAVYEALRDGQIGCAAVDVTEPEPLPKGLAGCERKDVLKWGRCPTGTRVHVYP